MMKCDKSDDRKMTRVTKMPLRGVSAKILRKKTFLLVIKSSPPSGGSEKKKSQHPRARDDYDEETAYESYMNPEPGFQSGSGDSVDAD